MKYGGHILLLQEDCIIIVLPYEFIKDKDKVHLEENVNEGVTLLYFVQSAKEKRRRTAAGRDVNHKPPNTTALPIHSAGVSNT